MNEYKINPNKINILTIGEIENGYSFCQVKKDISQYIKDNFGIPSEHINILGSFKIPTEGNKAQVMQKGFFDILIIGKNSINNDKGGEKIFDSCLGDLAIISTCTKIKGSYKYRKLEPINKSNLSRAVNSAMQKFLGKNDDIKIQEDNFHQYKY